MKNLQKERPTMKIEKVIKQLESILDHTRSMAASPDADEIWKEDSDALEFALTALRSMSEAGEPLSLEQLKQMVGKPVWIERIEAPYDGKWFIVNYADTENPDKTLYTDSGVTYSEYGKYFIAYPYPPAHIDRSEWISVKERLPEAYYGESDNVLVVDEIGIRKVLYFDGGCWCYPTGETYDRKVTHWMPLPEPPKED